MVCLHRATTTGVCGIVSAIGVRDVSGGGAVIIIGLVLAFFAIFADGGFEKEAFQNQGENQCVLHVIDEME